jgi:hypothetical protein
MRGEFLRAGVRVKRGSAALATVAKPVKSATWPIMPRFYGDGFGSLLGPGQNGILPKYCVPSRLCAILFGFPSRKISSFDLVSTHALVSANAIGTAIALLWSVFRNQEDLILIAMDLSGPQRRLMVEDPSGGVTPLI